MSLVTLTLIVALGVGMVLYLVTLYNNLVRVKNDVDQAWANIDVLLKQRHDEIPKLLETTQSYMRYEQATIQKVLDARKAYLSAQTIPQQMLASAELSKSIAQFFAVAENYPDLKANTTFLHLQERISGLENSLSDRREYYNAAVTTYNTRIQQFPDALLASQLHWVARRLFQVTEEDKADPTVELKIPA